MSQTPGTQKSNRSIRAALQVAADQAERRRKLVRWVLTALIGALLLFGLLVVGNPT